MSNKRLFQFLYSKQPKLTMVNGIVTFGASGAVATSSGPGVQGVTKLATGIYQIKLQDNYVAYIGSSYNFLSGVTGSNVTDGSFVTGTLYQITALGTTAWTSIGFDSDYTPAVGGVFVATGAGGSGGGTAKALAASNALSVEVAQVQSSLLINKAASLGRGSSIIVSVYGLPASGQVPALTSPASGSQMSYKIWFRDSTAQSL